MVEQARSPWMQDLRGRPWSSYSDGSQAAAGRQKSQYEVDYCASAVNPPDVTETEDDSAFSTDCGPRSTCSGDGVQSSLSSDEATAGMQEAFGVPEPSEKSIGSAGHPHRCTECHFFFFHPSGCRSGQNCRYCHEIHPRRSVKKTKQMIQRIQTRDAIPEEVNGTASGAASDEASCLVGLRYPSAPGLGAEPRLTFAVGQQVRVPAVVECTEAQKTALQGCLSFDVDPLLPSGLILDKRSGEISGTPSANADRQVYTVTASTQATGPCGIDLGWVPLTTCQLSLRVVDLWGYRPCAVGEKQACPGQSPNLEVDFVPAVGC